MTRRIRGPGSLLSLGFIEPLSRLWSRHASIASTPRNATHRSSKRQPRAVRCVLRQERLPELLQHRFLRLLQRGGWGLCRQGRKLDRSLCLQRLTAAEWSGGRRGPRGDGRSRVLSSQITGAKGCPEMLKMVAVTLGCNS